MVKVIGVKFKTSGRAYFFDPLGFSVQEGDGVIVETARGVEYGIVSKTVHEVEESDVIAPLKPIMRVATAMDTRMRDENAAKEGEALTICQDRIAQHGLDMKLISADYSFNGSKLVFYFTADGRVDFRELVKDLAFAFKTRIELRQVGVRDEAKMLGGLGSCGRPVCCKTFMEGFHPVSIKMAKEQNLSLSPTKISGLCGRLMCCLQYEQKSYETMRKKMPKVGKPILTADGEGIVLENNVLTEKTRVRVQMEDGTMDVRDYPYEHLAAIGEALPRQAQEYAAEKARIAAENAAQNATRNDIFTKKRQGRPRTRSGQPEATAPKAQEEKPGKLGEKPAAAPRRGGQDTRNQKPRQPNPQRGQSPAQKNEQAPAQRGKGSAQGGQSSAQRGQSPAQNKQAPAQRGQAPAQNRQASAQNKQASVQRGQAPAQNKQASAQNSQVPTQNPQTPQGADASTPAAKPSRRRNYPRRRPNNPPTEK